MKYGANWFLTDGMHRVSDLVLKLPGGREQMKILPFNFHMMPKYKVKLFLQVSMVYFLSLIKIIAAKWSYQKIAGHGEVSGIMTNKINWEPKYNYVIFLTRNCLLTIFQMLQRTLQSLILTGKRNSFLSQLNLMLIIL